MCYSSLGIPQRRSSKQNKTEKDPRIFEPSQTTHVMQKIPELCG